MKTINDDCPKLQDETDKWCTHTTSPANHHTEFGWRFFIRLSNVNTFSTGRHSSSRGGALLVVAAANDTTGTITVVLPASEMKMVQWSSDMTEVLGVVRDRMLGRVRGAGRVLGGGDGA